MILRPIIPDDHAAVLALNQRNVDALAPMDQPRLITLVDLAETAAVIEVEDRFAGFVITFAAGAAYDAENFAWFTEHLDDFCYLDRVVLDEGFRRRGLGTALYDALEGQCRRPAFALEVNLDPPNTTSLAFHRGRGFREVGQRESHGHVVSLMAKKLR